MSSSAKVSLPPGAPAPVAIRDVTLGDASAICAIYNPYVAETVITFEEVAVTEADMRQRIAEVSATLPWVVAHSGARVAGYAYATKWRPRASYRHSVETTVYLAPDCGGRGIGRELYAALIDRLRAAGIHRAIGGIALPNPRSVALHEKCGFKKVAHFTEVGRKFDRWIDVGYWEIHL